MAGKTKRLKAFTLIEALAVISIIGILATLTVYVVSQAQRAGRDARRKADLTAVSLAFQARKDAETCSNPNDIGYYPGRDLVSGAREWVKVSELIGEVDCGPFSEYTTVIPEDPRDNIQSPYLFDLSREPPGSPSPVIGRHYRLAAKLERIISSQDRGELVRMNQVWVDTFGGLDYPIEEPIEEPNRYSYVIGN